MQKNIDNRLKNANKQKVEMYRDCLQNILDNFVKNKGFDLQYKVLDTEKTKLVVTCNDFESSVDTTKSEIYKKEDFETEEELRKYIYKKAENTAKSVLIEHNNYMQMNNIKAKRLVESSLKDLSKGNDILNSNLSNLNLSIFTLIYFEYLTDIVSVSNISIVKNRMVIQFTITNPKFNEYTVKPFVLPEKITRYYQMNKMDSNHKNHKIISTEVLKHIQKSISLTRFEIALRLIGDAIYSGELAFEDIFEEIDF